MKETRRRKSKAMRATSRRKLELAGWRVGSVKEFIGLSDDEAAFVELKLERSREFVEKGADVYAQNRKGAKLTEL